MKMQHTTPFDLLIQPLIQTNLTLREMEIHTRPANMV